MTLDLKQYPPWWEDGITLYNRTVGLDGAVAWHRTRLVGCFFSHARATRTTGGEKMDADTFVCRIPENESYRSPAEWSALDLAGKALFFTLCTEDIIVPGHVDEDIDEGGQKGLPGSAFLAKYARRGAFRVSGVFDCIGNTVGSPTTRPRGWCDWPDM